MNRVALIEKNTLTKVKSEIRLSSRINWDGQIKEIWFQFSSDFIPNIDLESQDHLLLALIIPAMKEGISLQFEGSLSPILLYNSTNDLQDIFIAQNSELEKIKISSRKTKKTDSSNSQNIGVGFSAGVDSLSSMALLERSQGLKLTHLATLNVGAMGKGQSAKRLLEKYSRRLTEVCNENGKTPLIIDSNISEFFKDFTFQATHTIRTAAAILSMGNTFSHYFYSSGYGYKEIAVKKTVAMAVADPILLPLFSNETTQFRAIGTNLTRLEKVALVCNYSISYKHLDVCVGEVEKRLAKPNCGYCFKCRRQLISLDLLGKLDRYGEVFDLEQYKNNAQELFYELALSALGRDRLSNSDFDVLQMAIEKRRVRTSIFPLMQATSRLSWKIKSFWAKKLSRKFTTKPSYSN